MHDQLFQSLIEELSAGEYRNIVRSPASGSMMDNFPVVFATAESVRNPEKRYFIKCIWSADQYAGENTRLITNEARLTRIYEDLTKAALPEREIPIVDLVELRFLNNNSALLIIMEALIPLRELIEKGELSRTNVGEFLRSFSKTKGGKHDWIHFDICPKNLGLNSKKEFRLIDLDSYYEAKEGKFEIKTLAYKRVNVMKQLNDEIFAGSVGKVEFTNALIKKFRLEVCLCAIQICAGKLFEYPGPVYNLEEWFWDWLNCQQDQPLNIKEFWKRVVLEYVPQDVPLINIATEYEHLILENSTSASDMHFKESYGEKNANMLTLKENLTTEKDLSKVIDHYAKLIRSENFTKVDLELYIEILLGVLGRNPERIEYWIEIITISICYVRSAKRSYEYLQNALKHHSTNEDLLNKMRLVELWMQ
ncbi:hypothetical protein AYB33_17460 [Leptospira santarosai]|uniref:hypothetical protein n=1 Tax=Leptospira santarosai TaxID=28183 RepID=UPI00077879C8|nr:hypothetical protein [Leptospira santarosai]KXZ29348.1 hypothetical protein AYB33_17460 [Leptospira santarosai]